MRNQLILGAVVLAGGLTALSMNVGIAEAHSIGRSSTPFCKTAVEGRVGLAVGKDKAKKRARRKWAYDVKWKYGYRWTSWAQADHKDYHCKKKAGTWRCSAHANPCDWQAH